MTVSRRRVLEAGAAALTATGLAAAALPAPAGAASGWKPPPPCDVRVLDDQWIPMPDGVTLSLRLWLPDPSVGPCPAVLEMNPYRKADTYRFHDDIWGPALASQGIAYARVDVRGSGNSGGVITDEYSPAELDDGVAIIAWLAARAWCNGAVGMRGLSWGGINTLQIAARNPPALKAIMPMGCCDNRFTDDAHYLGGALGHTNFQWGVLFKAVMAGPPDPAVVGPDWQAQWEKRLAATPPILSQWLSHQRYDAYWRRGSVALDYGAIRVPTYLVSGWQDTYAHPVGRLLERLTCPKKGLIGPWGHTYPWAASPQGLDWAAEEVRWWRHWLCGEDTGVMDGPVASLFMPYRAAAEVLPQATPGRWIAEAKWPARTTPSAMFLTPDGLAAKPATARTVTLSSEPVIGLTKPEWLDRPSIDQSTDDTRSLVYDSAPLEAPLEILGTPTLAVTLASDAPVAQLAVRLTEVTPDGRSWLVTWGLLNLTHRDSHSEPAPLKPGRRQDVTVELKLIAHRFSRGSRIRIALSQGLWPLAWPAPGKPALTLTLGRKSRLTLPVRPLEAAPYRLPIAEVITPVAPDQPRPTAITQAIAPGHFSLANDVPTSERTIAATGVVLSRGQWEQSEIHEGQPDSSLWSQTVKMGWKRGDWSCDIEARYRLTSTAGHFDLSETLIARSRGKTLFEQQHDSRIARDLI